MKISAKNSTVLKEKGNKTVFWTLIYLSVGLGLRGFVSLDCSNIQSSSRAACEKEAPIGNSKFNESN